MEKATSTATGYSAKTKSTAKNSSPNPKNNCRGEKTFLVDYRTWAQLNLEGRRAWGDVFPDGKVPILSIAAQQAKLEGIKDPESVFAVDWNELSEWQQQAVLEKLSSQSGASKQAILKEIQKVGLPLRRKYIQSAGTNRIQLYF